MSFEKEAGDALDTPDTTGKKYYLLTWNLVHPSAKKAFICLAAAIPALMFASAVCAPIFLGVLK